MPSVHVSFNFPTFKHINLFMKGSVLPGTKTLVESMRLPHPGTEWRIFRM